MTRYPSADVTSVQIIGGCSYVAIATRLDDLGDAAVGAAQQICDKAAEVAYAGERNAISVSSKGGRELAIGIKGARAGASCTTVFRSRQTLTEPKWV